MRELSISECMAIGGGDDLSYRLLKGGAIFVGYMFIGGYTINGIKGGMIGLITGTAIAAVCITS